MDENTPHPGRILLDEVMTPLGVSRNQLARDIDVPVGRISAIVSGARAITADTALRLARYFGTNPELWMRLQADYDLARAREQVGREIEERVRVLQGRAPGLEAPAPSMPPEEPAAAPAPEPGAPSEPAVALPPEPVPLVAEPPEPEPEPEPGPEPEEPYNPFAWASPAPPPAAPVADPDPEPDPESEPAPPLGPAVSAKAPERPAHRGNGAFPGGAYTPWNSAPEPRDRDEPLDLTEAVKDDAPAEDEDVLDLSVDMVVPEPSTAPNRAADRDDTRESVPPIPDPPFRR